MAVAFHLCISATKTGAPIAGLPKDLEGTDESNQRPLTVFVIASDMLLTIG